MRFTRNLFTARKIGIITRDKNSLSTPFYAGMERMISRSLTSSIIFALRGSIRTELAEYGLSLEPQPRR